MFCGANSLDPLLSAFTESIKFLRKVKAGKMMEFSLMFLFSDV